MLKVMLEEWGIFLVSNLEPPSIMIYDNTILEKI